MSCGSGGKKRYFYTGNQVGDLNQVGDYNFVAGGPAGSGLSAGTVQGVFFANTMTRRPWERQDAVFDDSLLDATYPVINLQWFAEIELTPEVVFRVSDRSFYVQDKDGNNRYYDARVQSGPSIQVTTGEWLANNFQVSNFNLELNNRDGFFNQYLPGGANFRQWSGAKVTIKIGFSEKYDNYLSIFSGQITSKGGLSTTRDTISIQVYDRLDPDESTFPANTYSSDQYPDIDSDSSGKSVPLVYGDWSENVPAWGSIPATCVNSGEEDPTEYVFKVSDLELESIDSVWLHRGNNAADKPDGPIPIDTNCYVTDLAQGLFKIPTGTPVFQQPFILVDRGKAGPGSGVGFITSDGSINFLEQGVRVGDRTQPSTERTAFVTYENIKFQAQKTGPVPRNGSLGNGIRVQYVLLTPYTDPKLPLDLVVTVSGTDITVGIPSRDPGTGLVYGAHTANDIKAAIAANPDAAALVQCVIVGTVPSGYPAGTTVGQVVQTVPSGWQTLSGGVDDDGNGIITSVTNFQLTVTGSTTYNEGDEYTIETIQYAFVKNDKFSVVCKGKPLKLLSLTRLSDVSAEFTAPRAVALIRGEDTYFVSDDASRKIYQLGFDGELVSSITYDTIDPALEQISGMSFGLDERLWITDPIQSKIYLINPVSGEVGYSLMTGTITGISSNLPYLTGISVQPDNKIWIADKDSTTIYLVDVFGGINPNVVTTFDSSAFDPNASEVTDLSWDDTRTELVVVDRGAQQIYRLTASGDYISAFSYLDIADDITYPASIAAAQDGTIFLLDGDSGTIYNWNEASDANTNPCWIARDMLQKFNGLNYSDFDLSWNATAVQMYGYKTRCYISSSTALVTYINKLLSQFNVVFYERFLKFSLFWIEFQNFRTTGKRITEADIQMDMFKPSKETNQYFNSMTATFGKDEFTGKSQTSDTYISPSGVSFAGEEINRKFDMPNVYRRDELDKLVPLLIRLSVPEPEFIDVTFGFRVIRSQIHDFINIDFDQDFNYRTLRFEGGKRFKNVPSMVRQIRYNLSTMTVQMKLWSLGTTPFGAYDPVGNHVGGENDPVVLTSVGRLGRFSPTGIITGVGSNYVDIQDQDAMNAENLETDAAGLAYQPGFKLAVIDPVTQAQIQLLTIDSVSGSRITFEETLDPAVVATVIGGSGFPEGGTYLEYAKYTDAVQAQRNVFGFITRPTTSYPISKTQELEEQRGGLHSFDDGGKPYVFYPEGFTYVGE
jgi:hypothetical protein